MENVNLLVSKLIPLGIEGNPNHDIIILVERLFDYESCIKKRLIPSSSLISIISPSVNLCGFKIEKAFIDSSISFDVTKYIDENVRIRLTSGGEIIEY